MCSGLGKTACAPTGIRSRRFTPPCAVTVSIWSLLSGASCIRPSGNISGQIYGRDVYRDRCRTEPRLVDRFLQILNEIAAVYRNSRSRSGSTVLRLRNIRIHVTSADVKYARGQHQGEYRRKAHQQHRKFRNNGKSPYLPVTALSHNPTSQKQLPFCFQKSLYSAHTHIMRLRVLGHAFSPRGSPPLRLSFVRLAAHSW